VRQDQERQFNDSLLPNGVKQSFGYWPEKSLLCCPREGEMPGDAPGDSDEKPGEIPGFSFILGRYLPPVWYQTTK
jgi:hypothetical protein